MTAEHPELLLLPSVRRDSTTMSGGHGAGDPQVALRLMSRHHWLLNLSSLTAVTDGQLVEQVGVAELKKKKKKTLSFFCISAEVYASM